MNVLLFAPPKILFQHSAREWADATGGTATLFTDSADRARLSEHLAGAFRAIEFFDGFNDNDLVEKRAADLHAVHPFQNVVPLAEIDVLRAARLRERFGIAGLSAHDANFFRDKYEMKKLARSKGVAVPDFRLTRNALEVLDFVDTVGYPFVVKPLDGRGSAGVQILHDESELETYLASGAVGRGDSPLSEACIPGRMLTANGLYLDGKCVVISIVENVTTCFEFLHGNFLGLKMLGDSDPWRLRMVDFTCSILENALPMPRNGLFHVEVFRTEAGQLLLCEAACRLGGGIANEEVRAGYGVDIRMEFLKAECLEAHRSSLLDAPHPKGRFIGQLNIPPKAGVLKSIPLEAPFDWVELYKVNGVPGKRYKKMTFTNAEIVNVLVRGDSDAELEEHFHEFARWFEQHCAWDLSAA